MMAALRAATASLPRAPAAGLAEARKCEGELRETSQKKMFLQVSKSELLLEKVFCFLEKEHRRVPTLVVCQYERTEAGRENSLVGKGHVNVQALFCKDDVVLEEKLEDDWVAERGMSLSALCRPRVGPIEQMPRRSSSSCARETGSAKKDKKKDVRGIVLLTMLKESSVRREMARWSWW